MVQQLDAVGRWVFRHIVSFLLIVGVLVFGRFVYADVSKFMALVSEMQSFDAYLADFDKSSRELRKTSEQLKGKPVAEVDKRVASIGVQISLLQDERRELSSRWPFEFPSLKTARLDAEISVLSIEHEYLTSLRALITGPEELESLRRRHAVAYAALQQNLAQQDQITGSNQITSRIPMTVAHGSLKILLAAEPGLRSANEQAHGMYVTKKAALDRLEDVKVKLSKDRESDAILTAPLRRVSDQLNDARSGNWVGKIAGPVLEVLPIAARILALIILIPIAIKFVFYFILAPLAARRPAVSLIPEASGLVSSDAVQGSILLPTKISMVSLPIQIDAGQEILVHPEYLQSSTVHGKKSTKWLLNNSYPWSSILSGMVMLTRIQTENSDAITISAMKEPLTEVGSISLPEGSSIVLRPRFLIGVVSPRDHAIKITRHWRLASLHAWLTLQLRFLVFHGPCTLLVKGGRGIRLEPSQAGRSVNQSLTMGFSTNVKYSTVRCETFFGYLSGKQNLLNDRFAADRGICIYEESPIGSRRPGITGSGLEGFTESVLNVFGV